ncbi:ATP-dependent DNA helicase Q4 isoform X2 [Zootermopsis nevadensis]|uniref:DNA 3'-5' helicase n=1 Tax=Zootermopsis nevadensis TaxID=136037 RepID=A0A067QLC4_ZOONE|nr:ATP-dependent DNA helicase Q4 isoform X2 [Zootermopsis nevadensis]KDR08798.1 ATP-dependent DNA helicase Q4 [Zootermopsis nevadensis]
MELLEDPSFKLKYQKSKLKVKLWESEFRKKHGRNPSKVDIRAASQKVREAYKSYYKLKTLALQDSLMDITFSDDSENNTSLDVSEIKHTVASVESDKLVDQSDHSRLHRIALADIQNGSDVDTIACGNEKNAPAVQECIKDGLHDQRAGDLKDVWGAHLNLKSDKASDLGTKTLNQRSSSFHFSEKLFVGSKFSKKNPRKSRSFSRPSKSVENDGFPVPVLCEDKNMSSELLSCGTQQNIKLQFSLEGLIEEKFKVVTNSSPITNQSVSAIHRAVLTAESHEQKLIPSRTVDKGWLQRCTNSNSLEYQVTPVNDSGIESMESSTVTDQCSSTEGTPRLPQSVSDAVPRLLYVKSEQYLTLPDVIHNGNGKTVAASDDSDEDIICNSDESEHEDHTRMRIACGSKRKRNSLDLVPSKPLTKKQKTCSNDVPKIVAADDPLLEIPSTADIDKIAEAVLSTEKCVGKKKHAVSNKLTKKEILEKKMSTGQANDNFVRINIKKKVYVRGKKNNNYSKYKKAEWKKKKKNMSGSAVDDAFGSSGLLKCFKCGDIGHFARNCLNAQEDKLLPHDEEGEDDSPFPTLEEVEAPIYGSRRKVAASCLTASRQGNEQNTGTYDIIDSLSANIIEPLYNLKEDGTLIDTPPEVYEALEQFGHDGFRPGQEEAVMRILSGLSTLVTLSTGAGKSLCYQLPAYMFAQNNRCITLVVSPLVSLMEDQVTGVASCLQAACLHTNQTPLQRQKVIELAKSGRLNVLLVSPETVVSGERASGFGSILKELPGIAFACIDEAHCVSQWSHNFRPSYLVICKVLQEKLGVKTVLGLTATATKTTCSSIVTHLNIPDGQQGIIKDVPLPNNLILSVSRDEFRDKALVMLLQGKRFMSCQSIIIYCTRRDECERLARLIRTCLQDQKRPVSNRRGRTLLWNAEPYHAGLSAARRKQVQKAFMSGQLRIVVATVAFGMGINKSDIRAVIHYNMPRNFESYVQEVGRSGRDGLPAHCHLFLDSDGGDLNELRRHIYADSVDRYIIRKLLQRVFVPCKCLRIAELFEGVDFSEDITQKESPVQIRNATETPLNAEEDHGNKGPVRNQINCPGHEMAFSVDDTVKALDLPQENISTLLCYLELDRRKWIKVMPLVYTRCKVISYKGPSALKAAAKLSPPLAMAIALDQKRGISHDGSSKIEFPVVDIASLIGWDSGIVKKHLKSLEWTKVNDKWRRTGITVELYELGFRVLAPGNLSASELDEALDTLYGHVKNLEMCSLLQLKTVFEVLMSVSYVNCSECRDEVDMDRNENLKLMIRRYFEQEQSIVEAETKEEILMNEEQVVADVRSLVCMYRDTSFTGRSVARIFHGIPSPCFPAQVWGRCRFWRAHLNSDFSLICKVASKEILQLR